MKMNYTPKLSALALSIALIWQFGAAHAMDYGDGHEHLHDRVKTSTPIEHVIVIIGENHTFDNLYGGYKPRHGQTVENLLAKGIINADGTPGPNFSLATQQQASNPN
ncbi:MAG TPA: hypothetical protein DCQ77_03795, partial [Betaproteobacteria bacterium]|nr:hypothetical protein [Betaproteobacteria bacterium]